MPSSNVGGDINLICLTSEAEEALFSQNDLREMDRILRSIERLYEDILLFCLNPLAFIWGDANALILATWLTDSDDEKLVVITTRFRFHLRKRRAPFQILIEKIETSASEQIMKTGTIGK